MNANIFFRAIRVYSRPFAVPNIVDRITRYPAFRLRTLALTVTLYS